MTTTAHGDLRGLVVSELLASGFEYRDGLIVPPPGDTKEVARQLHSRQRLQLLADSAGFIDQWEDRLLSHFADGADVDPAGISPAVRPVTTEEDAALFRFASLHWAVPVSQGYGRRTRFLITDQANGKLIGIFALGDPVFNLRARDTVIGWDQEQRQARLYNVFDAFVLGAVDPYRQLIAGKLAALCTVSDTVIGYLTGKYDGVTTHIQGIEKLSLPVLVTTTSALGRSSIYNRVTLNSRRVFQSAGYTEGFGHFQFSDELFAELAGVLAAQGEVRGNKYGQGPNWKIRTIRSALELVGLPGDLLRHGMQRQVFLAPLGDEWSSFLRGETDTITYYDFDLARISEYFVHRWAIPRAQRRPEFRSWSSQGMKLTPQLDALPVRRQMRLF